MLKSLTERISSWTPSYIHSGIALQPHRYVTRDNIQRLCGTRALKRSWRKRSRRRGIFTSSQSVLVFRCEGDETDGHERCVIATVHHLLLQPLLREPLQPEKVDEISRLTFHLFFRSQEMLSFLTVVLNLKSRSFLST